MKPTVTTRKVSESLKTTKNPTTMKTFISLIGIFLICASLFAQSPQSFNYQAVLRDNGGLAISNQLVDMRFTILQGTPAVNSLYSETQTLNTNVNGLISTAIGNGMPVSGNFANIDWSVGPFFIKVELDADNSGTFIEMGTSQLLSVPFALYAEKAGNSFSGDYNDLSNKPQNVSTFSNDAGYITAEVDGSVTNEIQILSISHDTIFLTGGGFAKLPAGFDGDYNSLINKPDFTGWDTDASNDFDGQYSSLTGKPSNVSSFVNDAGYITAEVDGSTTNEIQTLSVSKDSIQLSSANKVKLPGVLVSELYVPTIFLANIHSTADEQYFKLGDIGTFTKQNDETILELIFNGHTLVSSYVGCNQVVFEIRIDNQAATGHSMQFPSFSPNTAFSMQYVTGFFSGISSGTHTISVWASTLFAGSDANGVHVNPGGFSQLRMMIKEYYGTHL
ncbi:MAG: hypothetical protein CVU11_06090 [Bacteroidetes bacterium HGW-Bacteroidetes-6]|nr:MAG: hypothetical protein CVU11_06090 [Bacteroidetes bacterium HGW-Bacteroidetes-6]